MAEDLKFQQRWEFRRRDDDFDSSTDDSKSCSSSMPVLKKHKLVSSLTSPENHETGETYGLQRSGEYNPGIGDQIKSGKAKKARVAKRKKDNLVNNEMERGSDKKTNRRKCKTCAYEPAAMNEVNVFMESLLEDLKVTRENLFIWMREEIHKLVADDTARQLKRREGSYGKENAQVQHQNNFKENIEVQHKKSFEENIQVRHQNNCEEDIQVRHQNNVDENVQVQHQNNFRSSMKAQNCHGGFLERFVNSKATDSNNVHPVLEERIDYGQGIGPMTLTEKEKGERVASSSKLNFQSSPSDQHVQMQHQNNYESGMRAQNCNGGPEERPVKGKKTADSNNCYHILENGVCYGKATGSMTSTEKDKGERLGLSVKLNSSFNPSNQNVQVQHQNNFESGIIPQDCSGISLESSVEGNRTVDSSNCCQVHEDQVDYCQAIGSMASTEKDKGERMGLSVKQKISSTPSQVGSSMYLTLPTVLIEPQVENHRLDTSPRNYTQARVAGNQTGLNSGRENPALEASARPGHFLGVQQEERIGRFTQMGLRNMCYFDQNSDPTSSIGTGFPVSLHHGMDGGFNIPSQVNFENQPREYNNLLGLRMNGGAIRFSGGSHALSENYGANNFRSQL